MKRPKTSIPHRPQSTSRRVARTAKDAAINLVRIEFDVSRLSMGIEQAKNRIDVYSTELDQKLRERARLLELVGK